MSDNSEDRKSAAQALVALAALLTQDDRELVLRLIAALASKREGGE